ncbi:heavy metal-binding domain-containing protein [Tautonia plasticadhaerens]|uniref:heavy metal-binding domain-containing protein n=1 Tax=Tautonia plasticadhaerens TaxID=2527974 RepID=UPI0011A6EF80|nr:heavy metal-binding domain-containing protein [Tautonia plasticadhaerens]
MRIPAALLVVAIVAGQWETLRNRWDTLTRPRSTADPAMLAVTNDVEYFCPMDPGVVSGWPGKCGVCHMALVVRKKGDATMLPDGVVARMQLSPYRVQLAGILTSPVDFRPLMRTREATGVVDRLEDRARVRCEVAARRAPWIAVGQEAEIRSPDLPEFGARLGKVAAVTPQVVDGFETLQAEVEVDDAEGGLRPGMVAEVTFRVPAAGLEPFRSLPSDPPPRRAGEPVQVYACVEHPDSIGLIPGRCPEDQLPRMLLNLDDRQRVRWWCPMHPEVTDDRPGSDCAECGGMELRPRLVTFRPAGQVLAVPESAVVDSGSSTVVFVESMPGMFDGVEVELGARCGDAYPVIRGLEAGQTIVIRGAFLLDAETRLNPSLTASYFGAARRQAEASAVALGAATRADPAGGAEAEALASLPPGDLELARRQGTCPVTGMPLGSMGRPIRVEVDGRVVFLCCSGCEGKLRRDPARYLGGATGAGTDQP